MDNNRYEKKIIASCIKYKHGNRIIQDIQECLELTKYLRADYFSAEVISLIWDCIREQYDDFDKRILSSDTLVDYLEQKKVSPNKVELASLYLGNIENEYVDAIDLRYYVDKLKRSNMKAELQSKIDSVRELLANDSVDEAAEIWKTPLNFTTENVSDLRIFDSDTDGVDNLEKELVMRRDNPELYAPKSYGIEAIDKYSGTGGAIKKSVDVILGASGSGKTKAMLHHAISFKKQGWNGIYFAFEQPAETIQSLYQSARLRFEHTRLIKADITNKELAYMKSVLGSHTEEGKLFFVDIPRKGTVDLIRETLMMFKSRGIDVDFIVIDYYKYMEHVGCDGEYDTLSKVSAELMFLAKHWVDCGGNNVGLKIMIAQQIKRSSLEKGFLSKDDVSSCKHIIDDATNAFGILDGKIQKQLGYMFYQTVKARYGIEDKIAKINKAYDIGTFHDTKTNDDALGDPYEDADISMFLQQQD